MLFAFCGAGALVDAGCSRSVAVPDAPRATTAGVNAITDATAIQPAVLVARSALASPTTDASAKTTEPLGDAFCARLQPRTDDDMAPVAIASLDARCAAYANTLAKARVAGKNVTELPFQCRTTPHAADEAWAVSVVPAGAKTPDSGTLTLHALAPQRAVAHVALEDTDGPRFWLARHNTKRIAQWNDEGMEQRFVRPLLFFDWDGDGHDEVLVARWVHFHEGGTWSGADVWTLKDGHIERYAPAANLAAQDGVDADGDGRVDLLYYAPFAADVPSSGAGFNYPAHGPVLLAHAISDGTFSRDDAVAKAAAVCSCRNVTFTFDAAKDDQTDDEWIKRIACARMRGTSATVIEAALHRACANVRNPNGTACSNLDSYQRVARVNPPLSL